MYSLRLVFMIIMIVVVARSLKQKKDNNNIFDRSATRTTRFFPFFVLHSFSFLSQLDVCKGCLLERTKRASSSFCHQRRYREREREREGEGEKRGSKKAKARQRVNLFLFLSFIFIRFYLNPDIFMH